MWFVCFHESSIWHTQPSCVLFLHGCGWPFCLGLCCFSMLNYLHHWFFQPFLFLPVNNTLCFPWLSIFEHLFFSYFTSCGSINITTFTSIVTVYVSTTGWTSVITIDFPWNIFCISTNFGQSIILCPFKP